MHRSFPARSFGPASSFPQDPPDHHKHRHKNNHEQQILHTDLLGFFIKTYDRVNLTRPKGKKEILQARAEAQGESVNAYINKAIDQRMDREAGE